MKRKYVAADKLPQLLRDLADGLEEIVGDIQEQVHLDVTLSSVPTLVHAIRVACGVSPTFEHSGGDTETYEWLTAYFGGMEVTFFIDKDIPIKV